MKFEIEVSDDDWKLMLKNRYGHDNVITRSYMLDIVHDIIDQMHEETIYTPSLLVYYDKKTLQSNSQHLKDAQSKCKFDNGLCQRMR